MKIVIFGGTGFVGTRLQKLLKEKGHEIAVRDIRRDNDWKTQIAESDAVINLAGHPLFKNRWDEEVKAKIFDSRVEGTKKIVQAMGESHKKNSAQAKILINASAIGYYPVSKVEAFTEESMAGSDFLAFVCREWEAAAEVAQHQYKIRTVITRFGVILGKNGGALDQIVPPFKVFAGGPIGNGQQWFSWIHLDDVCGIILYALENDSVMGPLNATAPEPVQYKEFAKTLGEVLHRPSWAPVPKLALYGLVGEAATILTASQKVLPEKTQASGYKFKFSKLIDALKSIFN